MKVYLLWVQTSDQYGTEELACIRSTKSLAERTWVSPSRQSRIQEIEIDGPVREEFR